MVGSGRHFLGGGRISASFFRGSEEKKKDDINNATLLHYALVQEKGAEMFRFSGLQIIVSETSLPPRAADIDATAAALLRKRTVTIRYPRSDCEVLKLCYNIKISIE